MTRLSLAATAAAAVLAFSLPAGAAPFEVSSNGNYGYTNVTFHSPDTDSNGEGAKAGAFNVAADEFGGAFTAWCLDLAHNLNLPSFYEITTTPFSTTNPISATVQGTLKALFDTAYSTLDKTNNAQSAGFQLALWEILTETSGTYNVDQDQGSFWINDANTSAARTAANGFLAGLGGDKRGDYTLTFLESTDGNQSLVTVDSPVAAVPLPAAGVLLFGALGGLGVMARRRKSAEA